MENPLKNPDVSLYESSILRTLAYFDIFQYPLSFEEICQFSDLEFSAEKHLKATQNLVDLGIVNDLAGFYSLQNNQQLVEKRNLGNLQAAILLTIGYRIGSFLYSFPYIKGIGISGSLSKNVAGPEDDIDFFIITQTDRLWIARTLMHIFKKITFLFGKQHWYCMNYYIDEKALEINEKNVFTATEVVTVIPVCGQSAFTKFYASNQWSKEYFPNHTLHKKCKKDDVAKLYMKRFFEFIFDNSFGNHLDNFCMKLTTKRWIQKEDRNQLTFKGELMGLKTDKHFARPNPEYLQKRILELYTMKLMELGLDQIKKEETSTTLHSLSLKSLLN